MTPAQPSLKAQLAECQRALRENDSRWRSLFDRVACGLLIIDEAGVVGYANPAARHLLGQADQPLVGELFGVPLAADEVTEVTVTPGPHRNGGTLGPEPACLAELRVRLVEWLDHPA
jgi:PAS domain-containing protein